MTPLQTPPQPDTGTRTAAQAAPAPTSQEVQAEHERIGRLERQAHYMQLANTKRAEWCSRAARFSAASAAVLAVFSGTSWTTTIGGHLPTEWVRIIAALAAIVAGGLAGVMGAMNWSKRAAEHQAAATGYLGIRAEVQAWRMRHPRDAGLDDADLRTLVETWKKGIVDVGTDAPTVTARKLEQAKRQIANEHDVQVWG